MGAFGKVNKRKVKNVAQRRYIETVPWFIQWRRGICLNNMKIPFLPRRLLRYSDKSILIIAQRDVPQSSLFIILRFTLHVSGVNHTHHQEYTKL